MKTIEVAPEKFGFVAGDPALDLVNTVHWRLSDEQRYDALEDYAHLLHWSRRAGLLTADEVASLAALSESRPTAANAVVVATRALREDLHDAAWLGEEAAAQRVAGAYLRAQQHGRLVRADGGWRWSDAELRLESPVDRVARAGHALLTGPHSRLVAQCGDVACGWLFLDTSRRHNRRWCSAAGCGDRNRAREYYRRHRATDGGAD